MISATQRETISWSTMKAASARDNFSLYYIEMDAATKTYDVFGTNSLYFLHSHVTGVQNTDEGYDFETNYKTKATAVASRADAMVLSQPALNTNGIPQVEIISRTGNAAFNQYTITSHNWCKKTTWFQNYDSYVDQAMTPDVAGVYTVYKLANPSSNTLWTNIDDFTNTMQDYALNAPPYGQHAVWCRDGNLSPRGNWRPVIKVNGTIATSGYTIDYATGKVSFGTALTITDTVTASFKTPKANGGSEFIMMPRPGKKLSIPHTEINMTDDVIITGTVVFEVWAGDPTFTMIPQYEPYYLQYRMEYKSMAQIFGLSVVGGDYYPAMGGTNPVTASAETGWSTDQKRGLSSGLREIPYDFGVAAGWGKSIVLRSDQFAYIKAYIKNDSVLGGEYCSLSLYVEEDDL